MRSDLIFIRQAAKFISKTLLGDEGPQRLLQGVVFAWYVVLSVLLIVAMGFSKLTLVNAILTLVAILTFIWVNIAPQSRQRKFNLMMDLQNPRHLISSVVKQLERKEFEPLERETSELNLHCYECLLVKSPHMHHCKRCDACVEYRHKHSKFIGKCIGRDNSIAYFYFLLANVLLNGLFCYSLGRYTLLQVNDVEEGADYSEASSSLLKVVGVVTGIFENQLLATGLALLLELVVFCECLDEYVQFSYAIANKMTLRELQDIWQHKRLFATIEVYKPDDEVTYMSDA